MRLFLVAAVALALLAATAAADIGIVTVT